MTQLISAEELSNRLSVKLPTIYAWKRRKKIPYVQLEGKVLFDVAEIEAWVNERRRPAGGEG